MCIRDSTRPPRRVDPRARDADPGHDRQPETPWPGLRLLCRCLLYTSDAADDLLCVDLGGRRIIKKKKKRPTCVNAI